MNVRLFDINSDYETVSKWWLAHNHAVLPINMLPVGVMVEENSIPVCASFVYNLSGTSMAQIAWTTTNTEVTKRTAHKAVNMAIDYLVDYSKKTGKMYVVTFSKSNGLTSVFKKKGFNKDKPHDLLIGSL